MIRFIALSGFLGAGKTTTMLAVARRLEAAGRRVAVVTNDQSDDLVDTKLARGALGAVGEVTGGCFCCRFEDLVDVVREIVEEHRPDTIIAESVGSCTDLQATVIRPLRRYYGNTFAVAPLTAVADPLRFRAFARVWERGEPDTDMTYLYRRQLDDAEVIVVGKADVVPAAHLDVTEAAVREHFPHARVLVCSALTGLGLDRLVAEWSVDAAEGRDLEVDYDRYAAAEAALAWQNRTFDVEAAGDVLPVDWGRSVLRRIGEECAVRDWLVGHAKASLESSSGLTKLGITGTGVEPVVDVETPDPVRTFRVVLNARIACEPEELDRLVAEAVGAADERFGTGSRGAPASAFKPGYPRPLHRLAAEVGRS
ncbi:GTP-binding protein [Saccharothrix violaceirubra]|uniref:G3E family GTPase n=1 Tax=Saccharothrix violaceirubra TaxID=413306 RepID=A0A7W7T7J1_9PSEU|nr:GTP-binding protein [Saccharothrix violaceirubra]MBB4967467.1 G3E family GTPase [Saccharothrix violaceirubra]